MVGAHAETETSSGQREIGKPRETSRGLVEREMAEMGKTWN